MYEAPKYNLKVVRNCKYDLQNCFSHGIFEIWFGEFFGETVHFARSASFCHVVFYFHLSQSYPKL